MLAMWQRTLAARGGVHSILRGRQHAASRILTRSAPLRAIVAPPVHSQQRLRSLHTTRVLASDGHDDERGPQRRGKSSFSFRLRPEQQQSARPEYHHDTTDPEEFERWLKRRRLPCNFWDRLALKMAESLSIPVLLFFRRKYLHRATVVETISAVPGMVGGGIRHLRALRLMRHDGGWIHYLLAEAENERMHLLTWMKVCNPSTLERVLVVVSQVFFVASYTILYVTMPSVAHRMVAYLAEESVDMYTEFLRAIEFGRIKNRHAPQIAIDYWRLSQSATLKDVVRAIRTDEAHHRDVNHHFADRIVAKNEDLRNWEDTHEECP